MTSPYRLCQHMAHINHFDLIAFGLFIRHGYRIRHEKLLHNTLVDDFDCWTRQDTVRHKGIDRGRAGVFQVPSRQTECTARIRHVVDQDCCFAFDRSDEDHT
jgi:hypothetical protein